MAEIDLWLYGKLARYGGAREENYANVKMTVTEEITLGQLLERLQMPTTERGFTFINGKLSAMPGLQPDLDYLLGDGDRVAFFHLQSMWPFQYRQGAALTEEMEKKMDLRKDKGIVHTIRSS